MSDELIQRVLKIITTVKRLPVGQATIDSSFEELGIDSMDGVEILFGLENEFDITIPDEQAKNIRSIRQMAEGVAGLVAAKPSGETAAQ